MNILAINKKDIEHVHSIENRVFEFPWSKNMLLDAIINTKYPQFKICIENKLAGYILYNIYGNTLINSEAEILNIAVDLDFQGQGLGTKLLKHTLNYIERYSNKVFLEVREDNITAQHLYNKFGFKQLYKRKKYYNNTIDAIVMLKEFSK